MKYLRTFESVEHDIIPKEIQDNLKDILLDLQDVGFDFSYNFDGHSYTEERKDPYIEIFKIHSFGYGDTSFAHDCYDYSEIKDVVDRIGDYLNMVGYDIKHSYIKVKEVTHTNISLYKIEIIKQ